MGTIQCALPDDAQFVAQHHTGDEKSSALREMSRPKDGTGNFRLALLERKPRQP